MMTHTRHDGLRSIAAWTPVILDAEPTVLVTLGTNKAVSEEELIKRVKQAVFMLDRQRLQDTRRPDKRPANRRTAAFVFPEKVGLNAHVHMLVWHPSVKLMPDSGLVRHIADTRDKLDYIGAAPNSGEQASRLERIWREVSPGGHYHARWVDDGLETGVGYCLKELKYKPDRDVHLTQYWWPDDQYKIELGMPLKTDGRPKEFVV